MFLVQLDKDKKFSGIKMLQYIKNDLLVHVVVIINDVIRRTCLHQCKMFNTINVLNHF